MTEKKTGLDLLREPFPENLISKLPKGTKAQNECPANEKINCKICGGWHHPKIIHLDYVGHAALTDRLLNADPNWTWEPFATNEHGLPAFDASGGLWIRLTVCGQTRIGYGHAASSQYKDIGAREKEVIGDALRNAAMRFGAALDLWHKGDLHGNGDENGKEEKPAAQPQTSAKTSALPPVPASQVDPGDVPEPPLSTQMETPEEPKINATHKRVLTGLMKKEGIISAAEQIEFYDFGMCKLDTAAQAQKFINQFAEVIKAWKASKGEV